MATTPPTHKLTLKILFWNSRSISQRSKDIESITKNYDIFICVELWLTKNDNIHFPGFFTFRKDRSHSGRGGIIIFMFNANSFILLQLTVAQCRTLRYRGMKCNN